MAKAKVHREQVIPGVIEALRVCFEGFHVTLLIGLGTSELVVEGDCDGKCAGCVCPSVDVPAIVATALDELRKHREEARRAQN
jgi:hypothetical protein